jgi:predicted ATPase
MNLHASGDLPAARRHYEDTLQLYDPRQHHSLVFLAGQDPGINVEALFSWLLWHLGYPEQALRRSQHACTLGADLGHAHTLAIALGIRTICHILYGKLASAHSHVEETIAYASAHSIPTFLASATISQGWLQVAQGQEDEGFAHIRKGLADYEVTGTRVFTSWHLVLFIDACRHTGRIDEGLAALSEAFTFVEQAGERVYEAELWRLKGELLLAQESKEKRQKAKACPEPSRRGKAQKSKVPNPRSQILNPESQGEAEACFLKAIDLARQQHAKSLELRAAMSLVRLRQQQVQYPASRATQHEARSKLAEAHSVLSEVYGWFTEGFDTRDLQEAEALLGELAGASLEEV